MFHQCKKCLLLEAGEKKSYESVTSYLDSLSADMKVDDGEYSKRIKQCKNCEYLISGMCLKCGCYVEIRARLKDKVCADYDNRKW